MFEVETPTNPKPAFRNFCKQINFHGMPIGVIHRINTKDIHTTRIFYFDGHVQDFTGFICGSNCDGSLLLAEVMRKIPCGFIHSHQKLILIGGEDDAHLKKAKKDNVDMHYVFNPIDNLDDSFNESNGYNSFEDAIEDIYIEEKGQMLDLKGDES